MAMKQSASSHSKWTDVLYRKFHAVWPFCALVFNYSHWKRGSRKACSIWTATARCRAVENCITVHMKIDREPLKNDCVPVIVTVNGSCQHASCDMNISTKTRTNRRALSGKNRSTVADYLLTGAATPKSLYNAKLSQMCADECNAGNTTECQTPHIYRQATFEARRKTQLDRDVVIELMFQRDDWLASDAAGKRIKGYI